MLDIKPDNQATLEIGYADVIETLIMEKICHRPCLGLAAQQAHNLAKLGARQSRSPARVVLRADVSKSLFRSGT
jgi:hypothetical protein